MIFLLLTFWIACFAFPHPQKAFSAHKDLQCDFQYNLSQPLHFDDFKWTWYINAQYIDYQDSVPQFLNDSKFTIQRLNYSDPNTAYEMSMSYHLYRLFYAGYFFHEIQFKPIDLQNGVFQKIKEYEEEEDVIIRILDFDKETLLMSFCSYLTSSLNLFMLSKKPIKSEIDLQTTREKMEIFQKKFEAYYPKDFYIFPLQLPAEIKK